MTRLNDEIKQKVVRLHLQDDRTLASLAAEYGVSRAAVANWVKKFREECQISPKANSENELMKQNLELKRQLKEAQKENDFLKKAAAFFAKEID